MEDIQNTQLIPGSNDSHQRGVSRVEALTVVLVSAMTFPWIAAPRISAAVLLAMGGISQLVVKRSEKKEMPKMPEMPLKKTVSFTEFYKETVEKDVGFCARHKLGEWSSEGKYHVHLFPLHQFFTDNEWEDSKDSVVDYLTEPNIQEQEEQIGQNPFAHGFQEETK